MEKDFRPAGGWRLNPHLNRDLTPPSRIQLQDSGGLGFNIKDASCSNTFKVDGQCVPDVELLIWRCRPLYPPTEMFLLLRCTFLMMQLWCFLFDFLKKSVADGLKLLHDNTLSLNLFPTSLTKSFFTILHNTFFQHFTIFLFFKTFWGYAVKRDGLHYDILKKKITHIYFFHHHNL